MEKISNDASNVEEDESNYPIQYSIMQIASKEMSHTARQSQRIISQEKCHRKTAYDFFCHFEAPSDVKYINNSLVIFWGLTVA